MIGTGRAADRDRALGLGVEEFVDLESDRLEDAGQADVVLDLIGGDILKRSIGLVRAGGTLVTTIEPPTEQPENGRAIFFVVEADRSQLAELAQRLRDGRLSHSRPRAQIRQIRDSRRSEVSSPFRSREPRPSGPQSVVCTRRIQHQARHGKCPRKISQWSESARRAPPDWLGCSWFERLALRARR